jgi:hypothetical protein
MVESSGEPAGSIWTVLVEKLLDWPFLFCILIVVAAVRYRNGITAIMDRVSEFALSKDGLSFKIGADEVSLDKLDSAITARLRDLQEEIEEIRSKSSSFPVQFREAMPSVSQPDAESEIPPGLDAAIADVVYPMLASKLWVGRYVETLAKSASVSEETMLKFCRSRSDIGVFKDGTRWVAALAERLNSKRNS